MMEEYSFNISDIPLDLDIQEEEPSLYPINLVIPFTVIYSLIFIIAIIGNIATCLVIIKNSHMQTATNYYLFSLACSDLLLVRGLPIEVYKMWSKNNNIFGLGKEFCISQGLAAETSANATILTIMAVTIERYVVICHPNKAYIWSKSTRCYYYIIAIWIIAIALAIPQVLQIGFSVDECIFNNNFFEYAFTFSACIMFFLPMSLITVMYILIALKLRRFNLSGRIDNQEGNRKNVAAQKRVVTLVVAVVGAFFICWAPFHAQRLLAVYFQHASKEIQIKYTEFYRYLWYISGVLYYLSTVVNPVLYQIMSKKFRKAFKETFKCSCTKQYEAIQSETLIEHGNIHLLDTNKNDQTLSNNQNRKVSDSSTEITHCTSRID